jgi:hypothetical protein
MKAKLTVLATGAVVLMTVGAFAQEGEPPAAEAPAADAPAPAPAPPPPAGAAAPPPAPGPAPAPVPVAPAPDGGARTHDGFYFRIGLNGGPLMLKSDTDPAVEYSGFQSGFDLMFGGSPAKGLAIGGALVTGRTSDPKVKLGSLEATADGAMIFAGVSLFADWYINPNEGLHFLGMLGFAAVDFVSASGQSGGNDPTGTMLGLGVGYDFWISDEWSIGPIARVLYAPVSSEAGGVSVKYNYVYPSIGVGFTLH